MKPYSIEVKVECKRLFVDEGRTPGDISALHSGKPSASCISNWANETDQTGKTWYDYRDDRADQLYEETTPGAMARLLHERIQRLLEDPNLDTKQADALSKYVKALREITEPKYQISMMYQVLSEFVLFVTGEYPALVSEPFIAAIRDFKNLLRSRLT